MSEFVKALESYRRGALSRDELLSEVERQLASGEADASALIEALQAELGKGNLPGSIRGPLLRTVQRMRAARLARTAAHAAAAVDDAVTVFIDEDTDAPQAPDPPAARPESRAIAIGTVLKGRFRLIYPIGEGGMSIVYNAVDLRKVEAKAPKTHVAVKILTVPARDFTQSLQVLQAEALKLQRLPHPNIVRVIDVDRDDHTVFMTMEYLSGESLKRKMSAMDFKGMSATEATRIIEAIASGLEFAHRQGIVHGDLKPGNVLITEEGEVKIIDFGVARLMTRDPLARAAGDERPKRSALTPPYASPEMLEKAEPDPRDDIYALACIAHELLTGRHPFDRRVANEARDSGAKLARHSPLSAAQYKALAHGLEFERAKRTPTAAQFLEEFRARSPARRAILAASAAAAALVALGVGYYVTRSGVPQWLAPHRASPAPGTEFRDCPTCPRMRALPPGRFSQGAAPDAADAQPFERPKHPVVIGYAFGIGAYEVTVGEYGEFAAATARQGAGCAAYDGAWKESADLSWDNVGFPQTAAHPVACVSWRDARDYAAWLSQKTGQKYRLPSESEWEYAARAGADAARPWDGDAGTAACGSANVADQSAAQRFPGWQAFPCSDGYVYTAPVGSFQPNGFGLYDMLGNVSEWVQDCWHDDYAGAPADGSAWSGTDCAERGLRGGSWFTAPSVVSLSARNRFADTYRSNSVGFRLVREIKP